ncbi:MAG: GNAT family N-acetyltransferase [Gemmatimonadota bacterium]
MRVEYLNENDATRWEGYVGSRASAITDVFAWRLVVRDAYDIASHFTMAVDGDRVVGALALFEMRHPVFGHYLASAVFGNDGGLFHDTDAARDALVAEARALASRLDVAYLLIRTRGVALKEFHVDGHYRASVLDLAGDAETALNQLPATTRNQVRRGMKEGFTVSTGADQINAFHDVFHEHMRNLGSPAHGMAFYRAVQRHLGDRVEFYVVRDGATLVAGALLFWINGTAQNYHTVSLRRFNRRCPNYLLYWRMIEASYGRGLGAFDMGRSEDGSSQLKFKENWGTDAVALCYNYHLVRAKAPPALSPSNPRFRAAIAVWSRLPVFVTKAIGPRLISGLA